MGNPRTVRALKQQLAVLDPMVIFVSETRLYKNKVDNVRRRLGMAGCLDVERSDSCVGLLLMWSDRVEVELLSFSDFHIDVSINDGQKRFRFTGIYGQFLSTIKREA
ncbi:hypothetical protein V6N13_116840 [Hibiscus sabdariffa]